jgi:hypothetical protein
VVRLVALQAAVSRHATSITDMWLLQVVDHSIAFRIPGDRTQNGLDRREQEVSASELALLDGEPRPADAVAQE